MSEDQKKATRTSGIKVALAVVPALLIVSICVALYLGATADKEESQPYEGEVTVSEMSGYLEKLNEVIAERRLDTEEGQLAFRQINAMTMGTLGPENLGYEIFRSQKDSEGGLLWSTIWIDAGNREAEEVVLVAIPQAESGTGPAFALGLAEYLASFDLKPLVRVVFYPPLVEGDLGDWLWERCGGDDETLQGVVKITGGDPRDQVTVFHGPEGAGGLLTGLQESKLWSGSLRLADEPRRVFEVELLEQGMVSRDGHAKRLIDLLPVVKELVERVAER